MSKKIPRVRKDGRCYVCKGPRVVPETRQKGVPVTAYTQDPFCSAVCSRTYWGNPLKVAPSGS
jgi:hypothetical protein